MFVDTPSLPDGSVIEADLCIIGGGPAGLTIAKRLAGKGIRIALLESGGESFRDDTDELAAGELVGIPIEPLKHTRRRVLGGTSTVWNGQCRMLDDLDFKPRAWMPHSGWPLSRKDLDPYYAQAHEILRLTPNDHEPATWLKRTREPVIPVDGDILFHRISLVRPMDFWEDYAEDLEDAPDVAIHAHATVLGIRATADGRSVDRLDIGTLDGKRLTAKARHYVLACGGIENARLLLLSNDVHAAGLGNANDIVGRFFMEHPRFVSGMLMLSGAGMPIRGGLYHETYVDDGMSVMADLGIHANVLQRERIGNFLGRLDAVGLEELGDGARAARRLFKAARAGKVPDRFLHDLWEAVSNLDDLFDAGFDRFSHSEDAVTHAFEIESYIEQQPDPDNRVTLSHRRDAFGQPITHLNWTFSEIDKRTARVGIELVARAVGAHGAGRVKITVEEPQVFPATTGWGHHHMGTTRMHDDPKQGVVDRNARVHDLSNLFVAGSSVFPTSGCATPTMTLVSLALRLADHLKEVMSA